MNRTQAKVLFTAAAALALLGGSLAGCAAVPDSEAASSSQSPKVSEAPAPEMPADLTGEWMSTNSGSEDSYQSATIDSGSIKINWVSDGGNTKALYWAGSYEAPTESGVYSWDSQNDTEKTSGAMLASSDPIKTFSYNDKVISYDVSAMGVTKTVTLERK
ncbi:MULTISPECIES: hypothetical protein [Cryobacterium]|uniref:hypothetical protein n=1 Tax=Cryobacterium TaxID=69578 RepID=UPI0018E0C2D7|nr:MULTISPECIES: hypothetical protein [Cryobacterium]